MATLKQFFDTDFTHALSVYQTYKYTSAQENVEVIGRIHFDFNSNTKYISYYVPACASFLPLCDSLISNLDWAVSLANAATVKSGFLGESPMNSSDLKFSGRIFVYSQIDLPDSDLNVIIERGNQLGQSVQFRGPRFAEERSKLEKPMAFIAHDSRDKDLLARPLAIRLQQMRCPVWYDEFSLSVGDSLRGSIEKGLKECKKCILILSSSFLSNTGWTKMEFDSIFTRQILERKDIVLPVWHGVTPGEIYSYSPSLADKFAVDWSLGEEEVARRLYRAITAQPSDA